MNLEAKLAYAAGIVDGEGCIRAIMNVKPPASAYGAIKVRVTNTDIRLINWLLENFGGSFHNERGSKLSKLKNYGWTVACKKAEKFLRAVLPYLLIKKEQAEVALQLRARMIPYSEYGRGKKISEEELQERQLLISKLKLLKRKNYIELD